MEGKISERPVSGSVDKKRTGVALSIGDESVCLDIEYKFPQAYERTWLAAGGTTHVLLSSSKKGCDMLLTPIALVFPLARS